MVKSPSLRAPVGPLARAPRVAGAPGHPGRGGLRGLVERADPVPRLAGAVGAAVEGCSPARRGPASFSARCGMRERERQLGTGFGFGIFFEGRFGGEITLSSIQRGPFQNGSIGYWVDEELAGEGLIPEAVVVVLQFAFETLRLHRIEVAIIPRNMASRRVVEKLGLRNEGVALGYPGDQRASGRTTSATP